MGGLNLVAEFCVKYSTCQVLDLDSFIAEKVEKVISAAAPVNFILSLALFINGVSLPVLLMSLQLKNQKKRENNPESCLWQPQITDFFCF